ncbi:FAD-dependent oxidoreductase [Dactylosporangium sp. CS-033363]|uniref:FAD-dependent oxidoreductase n=1 Tax=Dactylosporangium sp. CS-033363 TaxID=3239935 RepID=UPI003D90CD12
MRVVVNLTRCQGYAQCAFLAPEVFRMHGNEALLYDAEPDEAFRAHVQQAAAACPVQAILVDRLGAREAARPVTAGEGPGRLDAGLEALRRDGRIVIVGASLAGTRAAAVLRRDGFRGRLTLIGDEPFGPYDRPPLSKQVLDGWLPADGTELPRREQLDAEWMLGTPATGLERAARRVRLADGRAVDYDRLLIATGARARPWPDAGEAALDGVFVLRGRDDAAALRRRLDARPDRVLVIGAGFTGSEVASVCRERGLAVTVAERGETPLVGALGAVVGAVAADLQRSHGVDLRCGVTVSALEGDGRGRLRRAHLSDGTTVDADVAVVALGAVRNTEWLYDSGLAVAAWGVGCDAGCRAFDVNGLVTDDVFVAGDVARFPHPLYDYEFLALEHWGNAVTQAEVAAHNMISAAPERWPHLATPVFWSSQFGVNIKSVGVPTYADEVLIAQGDPERRRFVAVYGKEGRITAAVAFDQGRWLEHYQRLIERSAPFPPDARAVDPPADRRAVPPGVPDRGTRELEATVMVTGHAPSERRAELVHHH